MDVCDDAHSDMLGRCLAKFLNDLDGGSAANKNNDSGNALSSSGALGSSRQGGGRDNNNRGHNQHNNNFSPGRGGRNGRGNFDNRGGGRGHNNNQGRGGGRGNNRSLHGAAFDRLNRGRPQDFDRNNNNRGQNFDRGGRNGGRMGRSGGRGFGGRDNRGRSGNNNFQQNHHQQQNSDNSNKRKGREEKEEDDFVSTALEKGLGAERNNTQQSNKRQRYDDNRRSGRGVSKSKSISYCAHDAFFIPLLTCDYCLVIYHTDHFLGWDLSRGVDAVAFPITPPLNRLHSSVRVHWFQIPLAGKSALVLFCHMNLYIHYEVGDLNTLLGLSLPSFNCLCKPMF